ncbi:inactive serine protease 35 isoform X2 [Narcine bancroftii]|uniref:inactive serine protease 35 isoform X2 n=1 Tax=Narcine bancroftii TaxID=1343680 RepID=UPI0038315702
MPTHHTPTEGPNLQSRAKSRGLCAFGLRDVGKERNKKDHPASFSEEKPRSWWLMSERLQVQTRAARQHRSGVEWESRVDLLQRGTPHETRRSRSSTLAERIAQRRMVTGLKFASGNRATPSKENTTENITLQVSSSGHHVNHRMEGA